VGVDHRGKGYATEGAAALVSYGFGSLGLHRIEASTSNHNPDSRRVMERLGMTREACLREAEQRDGQWVDLVIYGILAHEWRAANRGLTADS
jgi:RimJ/RimL family protein N-acetyltransferase